MGSAPSQVVRHAPWRGHRLCVISGRQASHVFGAGRRIVRVLSFTIAFTVLFLRTRVEWSPPSQLGATAKVVALAFRQSSFCTVFVAGGLASADALLTLGRVKCQQIDWQ